MDYNKLYSKYAYEFCKLWNKYISSNLNEQILTKQEKGLLLELYISLTNNNCYLYKDISFDILNNYGLPKRDKGIDNIQLNENNSDISVVCQCKNYGNSAKKQRLDHHKLGTFYQQIMTLINYENKNIPIKLVNRGNKIENGSKFNAT